MVCLDTTFLIDVIKGRKEAAAIENELIESEDVISVAVPSIIELFRGLYLEANLKHINESEITKIDSLLSTFGILELGKESAARAGKLEAELMNKGDKVDIEDIMIAAICIENDEVLITKNKKHFERIEGLEIKSY